MNDNTPKNLPTAETMTLARALGIPDGAVVAGIGFCFVTPVGAPREDGSADYQPHATFTVLPAFEQHAKPLVDLLKDSAEKVVAKVEARRGTH